MPEEEDALGLGIGPDLGLASDEVDETPALETASDSTADDSAPLDQTATEENEDSASPTDWTTVDFRRAKAEDFPEAERSTFQHFQDREKSLQRDESARQNDLTRREKDAATREQRLQEQELRRTVDESVAARLPAEQQETRLGIKQLLGRHDLDDDVRETLDLMDREMDERVEAAIAPLKPWLDKLPGMEQSITTSVTSESDKRHDNLVNNLDLARDKYPKLDDRAADVLRVMGVRVREGKLVQAGTPMQNYVTGAAHDFTSAYELVSGIQTESVQSARAEDEDIRLKTQERVSTVTGAPSRPPAGEMSDTEVRETVSALRTQMRTGV